MEQQKVFPTACFGFDKKVVLDYIYERDTAAKAKETQMEEQAAKMEEQLTELQNTVEELNAQGELLRAQLYSEKEAAASMRTNYERLKSDADQLVQVARNKDKELQIQLELNKQLQHRSNELENRLTAMAQELEELRMALSDQELLEDAKMRAATILEEARQKAEKIKTEAAAEGEDHAAEVARLRDELSQIKESVGKTLSQFEGAISRLDGEKGESRFFPQRPGQQEAGRVKVKKIRK